MKRLFWLLISVVTPFCFGFFANADLIDTDPWRAFVGGLLYAAIGGFGFGMGWQAAHEPS